MLDNTGGFGPHLNSEYILALPNNAPIREKVKTTQAIVNCNGWFETAGPPKNIGVGIREQKRENSDFYSSDILSLKSLQPYKLKRQLNLIS